MLDTGIYPKGIKIPDKKMRKFEATHLARHEFHGDWNCTMASVNRRRDATRPSPQK